MFVPFQFVFMAFTYFPQTLYEPGATATGRGAWAGHE